MSLKKYKYRVKDLSHDIEDAFKCHKVVQVKKWYGLVTIKEFPVYYYNDGTVKLTDNGWEKIQFEVNTTSGTHKPKTKVETIWRNYI